MANRSQPSVASLRQQMKQAQASYKRTGRAANPSRMNATENRRNDRAWLAVKTFNEMIPTLQSFARAVTGNRSVRVMAAKQSSTDGKTLYIQPPIELGDKIQHDRMYCEKRDPESLLMICKACATREMVMRRLFHEIAHIAFDSTAKPMSYERKAVIDLIKEWHPEEACKHAEGLIEKVYQSDGHRSLAQAFHLYLDAILKSIEDARVDAKMYRARPGLKVPTAAQRRLVFQKGIEGLDGTVRMWRDAPLNAQVAIGLLLLGAGDKIEEEYFAPEVLGVLSDPELVHICERALAANTVHNALEISIQAFRRLQEIGALFVPKCEVPPPSLNQEPDDEEQGDAGSDGGSDDENSDSKENNSGDADDPGEQSDPGQSGGSGRGDDAGEGESSKEDGDPEGVGDDDTFDNEDSRGSGDRQQGAGGDDEPEDGDVSPEDDREESSEQGDAGSDDADDAGDSHGDGDGGDASEPNAGNEVDEPEGVGEGDGEPDGGEDADSEPGEGDDGAGSGDDDRTDGEPGEDPEGDGAGSGGADGDDDTDGEADPEEGVADDPGAGEPDGDDDLDPTEDLDGDGAEAPSGLTDESVWEHENPEQIVEPNPFEQESISPEEMEKLLEQFLGHGHDDEVDSELLDQPIPTERDKRGDEHAIEVAVGQEAVFDTSSKTVRGVEVVQYPWRPFGWMPRNPYGGQPKDFMPSESIIGGSLLQARVVFSANKVGKHKRNLKAGRINTRVLGRRAALEDPRLFQKKQMPGKRDYFVVIGVDCSGSTQQNYRNARIKRAVFAKAEMLNRLGIPFAIYGHTGAEGDINRGWYYEHPSGDEMTEVWMMEVKGPNEPWNDKTRQRLADMPPVAENLDGHSLEFYRKVAEKSTATDRIIMYYTDGAMPAANYEEELAILVSQIETCKKKDITLMAVGINTDSPTRFGFDTVRVDGDEDLSKVVAHLKRRLVD